MMPASDEHGACSTCHSKWLLPLLLAAVLAAVILTQSGVLQRGWLKPPAGQPFVEAPDDAAQKVLLTINFGNGVLQNEAADWREGMTVADLLQQEPRISVTAEGAGDARFLTSLNGIANQGAGRRNWTYSVNGKFADRSFAIYPLRPNDHVLWTFTDQQ